MYENGAMLAVFLLIYSAVAGRIERSLISRPIVFAAVGFMLGAQRHDHAGGRVDRAAERRCPRRDRQPPGPANGGASVGGAPGSRSRRRLNGRNDQ